MVITPKYASEAGHWYAFDGSPVYEVPRSDGSGMRPTTLRDARKRNLFPSVTGIIRCAAAPGLERWKQEQTLLAALTLPRLPGELESAWLARVRDDSQQQARDAAERGTAIHAAIQSYYEGTGVAIEYMEHAEGVELAIGDAFGYDTKWQAEKSFAHPLGFGGKTDLHSDAVVLDFKTKEFGPDDKLQTWDEHAMQLAAYREGLGVPEARGGICYVSATVPGLAKVMLLGEDQLLQGWTMFKALLSYWQAKNRYRPTFDKVAA